jgi:hypothetical protein
MSERDPNAMEELESMIDANGLSWVLDHLCDICHAKAEHVQSNWQDAHLAKAWERAARTIDAARGKVDKLGLP